MTIWTLPNWWGIDDNGGGLWVNQSQKFLEHYSVCGELTLGEFLQVYTKEELIVADCFNEN